MFFPPFGTKKRRKLQLSLTKMVQGITVWDALHTPKL
jgi:hypothetical protein